MLSNIIQNLYVGDDEDAKRFYFPLIPIHTTIDLSGWYVEKDIERNNLLVIHKSIFLIDASLANDAPTLVHCNAGMDRSPFVVACFLYNRFKRPGYDANDAYDYVKERRPQTIIHDDWMEKYEDYIRGEM